MDEPESSFATMPTLDGKLRLGVIDPKLGTMENGRTVCFATLSAGAVIGLVKDCVDWLASISEVPGLNRIKDKPDGSL